MRIHSDSISELEVRKAARIAGVNFTSLSLHGSRRRDHAFNVILTGSSPRNQNGGPDKAATWDEWGVFLSRLFALDPAMFTPYYGSEDEFHWVTNGRFRGNVTGADFTHGHTHKWEFSGETLTGAYWVHECGGRNGCGALMRRGDFAAISN